MPSRKQELFAEHFVLGVGNRKAAILAGFSEKSAHVAAARMLKNDNVLALIELKKEELQKKREQDDEENWLNPKNIARGFRNIHDRCMQATPVMRYNPATRRMEQITDENGAHVWSFDSNGANRAWENIAKHVGFYELDNSQKQPIINVNHTKNNILIQQHGDGNETAGNTGELAAGGLLTLLPAPSSE